MGAIGLFLVVVLVLSAVFAGLLAPFDPAAIDVPSKLPAAIGGPLARH